MFLFFAATMAAATPPKIPPCSWTLPSTLYGEFSVTCTVPLRHTVSMRRQLCGRSRRGGDGRPTTDLATDMTVRNDTISYTAVGRYEPSQVGLYVVTLTGADHSIPFPQLILPLVHIQAVRWHREAQNLVTCLVEGLFRRGRFSLWAGDGGNSTSDDTVFSISVRGPGNYEKRDGKVRLAVSYTNNSMVFVVRVYEPREEKLYRCGFLPTGCAAPGVSDPIVLSSSRLELESQYIVVRTTIPNELRAGRLCCRYRAPNVQSVRWERSSDCTDYETAAWSAPADPYRDAIEVGEDGFFPKTYLNPRSPERWTGGDRDVDFCISSFRAGDPTLPAGTYRCVWDRRARDEGEHERSITIPERVDIAVRVEENRVRVRCDFEKRHSRPEGSRLDIERVGDGTIVFTVPLDERDLRDAADTFSSSPLSPNVTVRIRGRGGDEERPRTTSVEVVLDRVLLPYSAFRCRISDRCGVSASEIANAVPARREKTGSRTTTRGRSSTASGSPPSEKPKKTETTVIGDSGGVLQTFAKHRNGDELQRWSYTSCSIAAIFVLTAVILTWFA